MKVISVSCAFTMSWARRRSSGSVPYCSSTFAMSMAPWWCGIMPATKSLSGLPVKRIAMSWHRGHRRFVGAGGGRGGAGHRHLAVLHGGLGEAGAGRERECGGGYPAERVMRHRGAPPGEAGLAQGAGQCLHGGVSGDAEVAGAQVGPHRGRGRDPVHRGGDGADAALALHVGDVKHGHLFHHSMTAQCTPSHYGKVKWVKA